jgi:outer membrane cobalamin receptor
MIVSGTFFREHVDDPIANVTLSTTAALITRQRQNMGSLQAQGVDADALFVLTRLQLRAGYEYVNSEVTSFSANPALVGRIVPQVPAHVFTFTTAYNAPHGWNVDALLRASSSQFDDDQNQFLLEPYGTLGVSVSKQFGMTTWFVSAANLTNSRIEAGATPVITYASPRVISGGVRLLVGSHR